MLNDSKELVWFVKSLIGSGSLRLCGMVFSLLFGIILARNLGPDQYGVYGYYISVISIATIIVQFGAPSLIISQNSRKNVGIKHNEEILSWISNVVFINSTIFSVILLMVTFFDELLDGWNAIYIYIATVLMVLGNVYSAQLRAKENVTLGQLNESLLRPAFFCVILSFYVFTFNKVNLTGVMLINAISITLGFIIIKHLTPFKIITVNYRNIKNIKFLKTSINFLMFDFIKVLSGQILIIVLSKMSNTFESGLYKVAFSLFIIAVIPSTLLANILATKYAQYNSMNVRDKVDLAKMNVISSSISFLTPLLLIMFFFFFGEKIIIVLFTNGFSGSNDILLVLLFGELLCGVFGNSILFLTMSGKQTEALFISLISLFCLILSSFYFINTYGGVGAAYSMLLSSLVQRILGFSYNVTRLKFDTSLVMSLFFIVKHGKKKEC